MKLSRCLTFPHRLNDMLEDGFTSNIVGWDNDGRSFSIRDLKAFEDTILPRYFRHGHFSSFVRQLNMYNFHKVRNSSTSEFCFQNASFYRGNTLNCQLQRKVTSKKEILQQSAKTNTKPLSMEPSSEQVCSETHLSLETTPKHTVEFENAQPITTLISELTEEVRSKDYILDCDIQAAVEQLIKTERFHSIDLKFLPFILESLGLEPQKRLSRQMSIRTEELLAMDPDQPSMKLIL